MGKHFECMDDTKLVKKAEVVVIQDEPQSLGKQIFKKSLPVKSFEKLKSLKLKSNDQSDCYVPEESLFNNMLTDNSEQTSEKSISAKSQIPKSSINKEDVIEKEHFLNIKKEFFPLAQKTKKRKIKHKIRFEFDFQQIFFVTKNLNL